MVRQNLVLYISSQLQQRVPWSDIHSMLIIKGWREEDIRDAAAYIQDASGKPIEKQKVAISPRRLMHTILIFTLFLLAVGGIFTAIVLQTDPKAVADTSLPAVVK